MGKETTAGTESADVETAGTDTAGTSGAGRDVARTVAVGAGAAKRGTDEAATRRKNPSGRN